MTTDQMTHGAGVPPSQNVNYLYFVDYVRRTLAEKPRARVLDFGCGMGELVALLREAGFDCSGADVFYAGASDWDPHLQEQIDEGYVREIGDDGRIPFDDASFDLVISNQVFEHVEHLEAVQAQIKRVLRPRGIAYHHFPSREVVREGHIGIPMAHWMKPGPLRTRYTLALRRLGFGTHKDENPDPRQWTDFKLDWIDQYCFYRPYDELMAVFERDYEVTHREIDYCRFRATGRPMLERVLGVGAMERPAEWALQRLAFMALELRLKD